jgi:urease accessory protein
LSTDLNSGLALQRLMSWMSPSFPVGAFSYSHGLEMAVESARVTTGQEATVWIEDILRHGSGLLDGAALAAAYRAWPDADALGHNTELARAMSATRELRLEATAQGNAFWKICADVWPAGEGNAATGRPGDIPHAVAVGWYAAAHCIPLGDVMTAYLHAFAANLVSAVVRLVPLGQTDGQRCMHALETAVMETGAIALETELEDVRTSCVLSDICSMNHETQRTRLFRS